MNFVKYCIWKFRTRRDVYFVSCGMAYITRQGERRCDRDNRSCATVDVRSCTYIPKRWYIPAEILSFLSGYVWTNIRSQVKIKREKNKT